MRRPPPSCWQIPFRRRQPNRGDRRARTMSTVGKGPATCSWPVNPRLAGGTWTVTERRTKQDFAHQMRWLVDEAYPEVPVVRVGAGQPEHSPHGVAVRGLPSGRSPADCQTAGVSLHPEARQLAQPCPEPVEGMAEIEFSVLSRCCLKQRIPDEETLEREVQALVRERNAAQAVINWRFNTQDARSKLHRLYPFDS